MKKSYKTLACILLILLIATILKVTVFSNIETFVEHNNNSKGSKIEIDMKFNDILPEGCKKNSENDDLITCMSSTKEIINDISDPTYYDKDFLKTGDLAVNHGMLYKSDQNNVADLMKAGEFTGIAVGIKDRCVPLGVSHPIVNGKLNTMIKAACKNLSDNDKIKLSRVTYVEGATQKELYNCKGILSKSAC